jgi:hypothetical protein
VSRSVTSCALPARPKPAKYTIAIIEGCIILEMQVCWLSTATLSRTVF